MNIGQYTTTSLLGKCRMGDADQAEDVEPRGQAESEDHPDQSQPAQPQYKSEKYLGLFFGILTAVVLGIFFFFAVIKIIIILTGVNA